MTGSRRAGTVLGAIVKGTWRRDWPPASLSTGAADGPPESRPALDGF